MNRERWQQIDALLKSALERPAGERAAFVERACAGDEELRREVLSLVAHDESGSFMPTKRMDAFAAAAAERLAGGAGGEARRGGGAAQGVSSSGSIDEGRFVPGDMLAERYRVVGLLGRGGMGEVYRADDLKLKQPVALKFLPERLSHDGASLARFYGEVSVARQISHRNVCRVYDVGESGGLHFISMEYVRGEELASVLKRFGRLPHDKAVEIARQLSAGLSAIHERGVLHRDLKPANVMVDERGDVRITDFGLASLAVGISGREAASGTPAYMSPEQLAGGELTVRSDIYALGLVIYELFTGRRAFEARSLDELLRLRATTSTPTSPSSIVKDLDPLVERVIERCLEKDPDRRPASALQVAAALPGGDPIAAALAAGETPSPEMVAAAPKEGALRPAVAAALLAAFLVGLALACLLARGATLYSMTPFEKSPEVMRVRSQEIIRKLGYTDAPVGRAAGIGTDEAYLNYVAARDETPARWERLRTGEPSVYYFWYRQSPRYLFLPMSYAATYDEPAWDISGMAGVLLDSEGRLRRFNAVPPQREAPQGAAATTVAATAATNPTAGTTATNATAGTATNATAATTPAATPAASSVTAPAATPAATPAASPAATPAAVSAAAPPDWSALFAEAGLDQSKFQPVAPTWSPLHASDARAAWDGAYPSQPDIKVHVEAASYRGKPVYFEVINPWDEPARDVERRLAASQSALSMAIITIFVLALAGGALLALRNLRLGRGDRRGALRLALFMFAVRMLVEWVFGAQHYASPAEEFLLLVEYLKSGLFIGAFIWVLYVALEPFVRRRWPERIISWSRLMAGGWRDPLVGRDILVGSLFGVAFILCEYLVYLVPKWQGRAPGMPLSANVESYSMAGFPSGLANQIHASVANSFVILLLMLLFFLITRRTWLAALGAYLILFGMAMLTASTWSPLSLPFVALIPLTMVAVIYRYGLLASVSSLFVVHLWVFFPFTTDFTAWYASSFVLDALICVALVVYGFYTSLAGQPLFERGLLEE